MGVWAGCHIEDVASGCLQGIDDAFVLVVGANPEPNVDRSKDFGSANKWWEKLKSNERFDKVKKVGQERCP